jgi:hypothetical protein
MPDKTTRVSIPEYSPVPTIEPATGPRAPWCPALHEKRHPPNGITRPSTIITYRRVLVILLTAAVRQIPE